MGNLKPVVPTKQLKAKADKADRVVKTVKSAAKGAAAKTVQATGRSSRRGVSSARNAADKAVSLAQDLLGSTQAVLATSLSQDLNALVQRLVDGSATIYDKAMDAAYIATKEGGSSHRLFDGGHTITGAVRAGYEASTEDGVVEEAFGILQGLLRDGSTAKGLPILTWDKTTFDQTAEFLQSNLHIPKDWFYDLNSYDVSELLGGAVGVIALALQWNSEETESFGRLVGSTGLSSAVSANPALAVVSVAALAKAYHTARKSGNYADLIDGQFKGALGTGSAMAAASVVGVAGGPAGLALLAALAAGVLANRATKNVSITTISSVLAEQTKAAARDVLESASQASGGLARKRPAKLPSE